MQGWLIIHITGAVVTAILIFLSSASLIKNLQNWYRPLTKYLGIGSFIQVISGIGLLITSESENLFGFCAGLGIYLAIVIFVESLLFIRLHKKELLQTS